MKKNLTPHFMGIASNLAKEIKMKESVFKKIVNQIKTMTIEEYNKLLEQSKDMERDYVKELRNERRRETELS